MSLVDKLMQEGITVDHLNNALDTLSKLCAICNGDECKNDCPLRYGDSCFFLCGKDKLYQNVATIYDVAPINKIANMLGVKVGEPFRAIINGKVEFCTLCHDGMHYKEREEASPKLLEDIITGVVRIVKC